jgi:hypothetical protein
MAKTRQKGKDEDAKRCHGAKQKKFQGGSHQMNVPARIETLALLDRNQENGHSFFFTLDVNPMLHMYWDRNSCRACMYLKCVAFFVGVFF